MKFTILIGALALAATTFTTISHASAVFGSVDRGIFNSPDERLNSKNRGSTKMKSKFPDFVFKMMPHATKDKKNKTDSIKHSRSKGKKNNKDSNTVSVPSQNHSSGNNDDVNKKPEPPQTPQTPQKPSVPSVDGNGGGSNNSGDNNTNPPQLNSHDIKGFDPFGGLYGPGT
jgi:hypothetical protein